MALTKRSSKGKALTHDEMDDNLTHLGGDGSYIMPTTDGDSGQVMSTNGEGQVSFITLSGETGGSKTHTLTEAQLPSHRHQVGSNDSGTGTGGAAGNMELVRDAGDGNGPAVNSSFTGSGQAHTIVQPYIVVYMWKRTA